ncbi:GAF domain-containing protein [Halorarum halobium]|uniref:GAF domain-containing protein n=1 Tax=Halorarum halobium TaxID=3075121 RepID=UPI0028AFFE4E|nr:GAF domain-containing protein [Halobaculum sp. XH14]
MTDEQQSTDVTASSRADSPFEDGVLVVADGTVLDVDDVAASLFALAPTELRGGPLSLVCPRSPTMYDADRLWETITRSVETGGSFHWVFETGAGNEVTTEVAARATESEDDVVVLHVRDTPARTRQDWAVRPVERLHDVATQFEACSEESAVHELTVGAATDILDFDTSTVAVAEGNELVTKASTSGVAGDFHDSVPQDHGLAGETFQSGRSLRVDDVRTVEDGDPARGRYRSVVSVPIGNAGVFQASATDVGAFSERDLELAELLAGHAADALERIRSVEALRSNRRKIARLHDVADEMVSAERESEIFDLAVDAAEDILNFDQCTFVRAEDDQFVVATTSAALDIPETALGTGEGIAGRVLRTGESELMDDIVTAEDAEPLREDIVSGITVPIGTIGVFQAFSQEVDAFSERDVELAELLTSHVATCIERTRSERALERQKTQFSSLVASLPGMVFRTSTDDVDRLAFVNDYAAELTGHDAAALTSTDGIGFGELVHPDDRAAIVSKRESALAEGTSYEASYRLLTADSGERWVRERATGLFAEKADDSATLEGFLTDVTGNRRRAQLEVMNRFLRHNLRNDVQVIYGNAENLARTIDDGEKLDGLQRIQTAAAKLIGHSEKAGTLEGLLGSDEEAARTPLDLVSIVRRRAQAVERRFPVEVELSVPEACRVTAVPVLGAAVQEALENAARHGGDAPVRVEIAVETDVEAERGDVLLSVRDDGPGIPEQDRAALERRTETALTHSSGLGLWLIKWVVTASRGTLDIRTPADGGTELLMTLHDAEDARQPATPGSR